MNRQHPLNAASSPILRGLKRLFLAIGLMASVLFLGACMGKLKMAAAGSLIQDVAAATAKHDDLTLAAQSAPTYLLLLEGLLESNPEDATLLTATAEAYTSYGALVENDDPARARQLYGRARVYGLKSLGRHDKIGPLLEAPYAQFVGIAPHLKDSLLERVFWAASSWGAWISLSTESMAALAQLPKVIFLMEWVIETDETFYYGAPHLFLGMYHAALPPMLGGKPDLARQHFERAIALSQGHMLMAKVQMARFYARQVFDRELYVTLLNEVLEAPVNAVPQLTLQNVAAQARARRLLKETDEYF